MGTAPAFPRGFLSQGGVPCHKQGYMQEGEYTYPSLHDFNF